MFQRTESRICLTRAITAPDPLPTFKPLLAPLKDQPEPPDAARISFTLQAIQLTGNTALTSAELETYQGETGANVARKYH